MDTSAWLRELSGLPRADAGGSAGPSGGGAEGSDAVQRGLLLAGTALFVVGLAVVAGVMGVGSFGGAAPDPGSLVNGSTDTPASDSPTGSPGATATASPGGSGGTPTPGQGTPTPGPGTPTPGPGTPTPGSGTPTPGQGTPTPTEDDPVIDIGTDSPTPTPTPSPTPTQTASPTPTPTQTASPTPTGSEGTASSTNSYAAWGPFAWFGSVGEALPDLTGLPR